MTSIRVSNLKKAYKQYPSRVSRLADWLLPYRKPRHISKWIIKDISFHVSGGESVGIIGVNGAGKSTLLKIITGTTIPSAGTVEINGRIAALLELGMGFHPSYTGRQNAITACQLLGFRMSEISAMLPDIEDFAEIGEYFDLPIRTYSSGMQVRLAFSVATAIRPDILIIDEALSVGDAYFQHKSFERIRKFREQGTTLLFVSHSPSAIKSLCDRAILLHEGKIELDGDPQDVLDYYNAIIAKKMADYEIQQAETTRKQKSTRSGTKEAEIESVELLVDGKPARAISSGENVAIYTEITVNSGIEDLTIGILIRDQLGNDVFGTNSYYHGIRLSNRTEGEKLIAKFDFPAMSLGSGTYSTTIALHAGAAHIARNYDWWDHAVVFEVIPDNSPVSIGICKLPVTIEIDNT